MKKILYKRTRHCPDYRSGRFTDMWRYLRFITYAWDEEYSDNPAAWEELQIALDDLADFCMRKAASMRREQRGA